MLSLNTEYLVIEKKCSEMENTFKLLWPDYIIQQEYTIVYDKKGQKGKP